MTQPPTLSIADAWSRLDSATPPAAFVLEHRAYYRPGAPVIPLLVATVPGPGGAAVVISDRVTEGLAWLERYTPDPENIAALAYHLASPVISLGDAIRLAPIHIPKPWGQEIWYTGIEERGQSWVTDGRFQVPLPWLLALGRERLLEPSGAEPNLLKILDPLPEEVFGDLYFELHEEKREVYVVTAIDPEAWPQGRGAIRYGFDPDKRRRYGDDKSFRRAYLAAVQEYEEIRRRIDNLLDAIRQRQGVGLNEPVAAARLKGWLQEVPADLQEREARARAHMNSFTHLHPLAVGDVVKVSRLTPHALQHGVRTVEFQTPVYERQILNFAQKVLTQDYWDTTRAVEVMSLDGELGGDLVTLESTDRHRLEQVVRFDDFQALRLTLEPGGQFTLQGGDHYSIVMTVEGTLTAGSQRLAPEEAALIPRTALECRLRNSGADRVVCLLSMPV